ncbi:Hypothetical predicted protein [Xyrichtys novacula]|uniref:Uncharacterized protein n=1 Tax=Xyrichtys novacula TaxID=13765 RepID=A0AAV1GNW5_XYRNO|nr:Hypothetical predicted protein [Xyrichtys novacula]
MSERNNTNHDSSPTLGKQSPDHWTKKTDHRREEDAAPPPEGRRRTSFTPSRLPPIFDPPTAPSPSKPSRGPPIFFPRPRTLDFRHTAAPAGQLEPFPPSNRF